MMLTESLYNLNVVIPSQQSKLSKLLFGDKSQYGRSGKAAGGSSKGNNLSACCCCCCVFVSKGMLSGECCVVSGVENLLEEVANLRNLVTTMSKQTSELQSENDDLRKRLGLPPRESHVVSPTEAALSQQSSTASATPQSPEGVTSGSSPPPLIEGEGPPPPPPPPGTSLSSHTTHTRPQIQSFHTLLHSHHYSEDD